MPFTLAANYSSDIGLVLGYRVILYKSSITTSSIILKE
jgi:hypothetical protein